jgi:hypothetical protein
MKNSGTPEYVKRFARIQKRRAYKNNPNVAPFILSHSLKSRAKKDAMLRNYPDGLLKALCNGDRQESIDVYGRYSTSCLTLSTFTTAY